MHITDAIAKAADDAFHMGIAPDVDGIVLNILSFPERYEPVLTMTSDELSEIVSIWLGAKDTASR